MTRHRQPKQKLAQSLHGPAYFKIGSRLFMHARTSRKLYTEYGDRKMIKTWIVVLFLAVMIAVVVTVDLLFFRSHIWERLIANIGIVLVFLAFYFRFLKKP